MSQLDGFFLDFGGYEEDGGRYELLGQPQPCNPKLVRLLRTPSTGLCLNYPRSLCIPITSAP